jgi:hypothetical protein
VLKIQVLIFIALTVSETVVMGSYFFVVFQCISFTTEVVSDDDSWALRINEPKHKQNPRL